MTHERRVHDELVLVDETGLGQRSRQRRPEDARTRVLVARTAEGRPGARSVGLSPERGEASVPDPPPDPPAGRWRALLRALAGATRQLDANIAARIHPAVLSTAPLTDSDAFGGRRFWDSLAGRDVRAPGNRGRREQRGYADVADRMLTVSALVIADAADSERSRVASLLNEPLTQQCLTMQELQLRQCLSVSVDASERTYCLARHGLSGPGGCISAMAR